MILTIKQCQGKLAAGFHAALKARLYSLKTISLKKIARFNHESSLDPSQTLLHLPQPPLVLLDEVDLALGIGAQGDEGASQTPAAPREEVASHVLLYKVASLLAGGEELDVGLGAAADVAPAKKGRGEYQLFTLNKI